MTAPRGGGQEPFQEALLAWYRTCRRRLPWREEPSVYRTVVSEFMLQQTQMATVLPYFARWMEALPDFETLAAAQEAAVLKLWEGLGYYSRARNLHRLARAVSGRPLPRTQAAWLELPGIGPYTAAAIASIAFGEPAACVDGNVVRILSRITRNATVFRDSATASKAFAPLARERLNTAFPGDHNQAMMELGATVCMKHRPSCLVCPVKAFCEAARHGDPEAYPVLASKATETRSVVRVWCERDGRLLLHRNRADARRLAHLHELPTAEQAGMDPAAVSRAPLVAKRTRGITRYRIEESIHEVKDQGKSGEGLVWVGAEELDAISLSGPHRRWITQLRAARRP